jgi:geranylgeranylglycerol-phosphate geranylgeranyltransferase
MPARIKSFFKITRPLNNLITFISVWVGSFVGIDSGFFSWKIIIGGLAAACISAGGYVINDYFDIEIDKINRPERPLAAGLILPYQAITWSLLLFAAGLFLSWFLNLHCFAISCIAVASLLLYSYKLKRMVLAGNLMVSIIAALVFIFGGAIVNNIVPATLPAAFAFLFHFGREIIKDLEDMRGDQAVNAKTLPIVAGEKVSHWAITVIFVLLVAVTLLPYVTQVYGKYYFYTVFFGVDIIIVSLIFLVWDTKNYARASRILKWDMLVGLAAICLGRL